MKSRLIANEPNPYRRIAMLSVIKDIDVKYDKYWRADMISWIVYGGFTLNNETWTAPEMVDDECLNNPDECEELYRSIDGALLKRLFALKRIERRLH